jgi:hypothetical protein
MNGYIRGYFKLDFALGAHCAYHDTGDLYHDEADLR